MHDTINKVSSDAVKKATGKDWEQWIRFIDRRGGDAMEHKAIVKLLARDGKIASGWWQQMVCVGYEHAKGRRVTGETADAGFQIGVQKAIPLGSDKLWDWLLSRDGLRVWLGSVAQLELDPGATFTARKGPSGEIRSVKPGQRLRLRWRPDKSSPPSTLQLTLSCPRNSKNRTTLRFHHEKLSSAQERERMRDHWKHVLDEIVELSDAVA